MKSVKLGNFEEMVLLLIGALKEEAYSVSIVNEYENHTGQPINISAIHTVLYRLEKKGYLTSELGESSSERGGKRKRIFYLTASAVAALNELAEVRDQLRQQIPALALKSS